MLYLNNSAYLTADKRRLECLCKDIIRHNTVYKESNSRLYNPYLSYSRITML